MYVRSRVLIVQNIGSNIEQELANYMVPGYRSCISIQGVVIYATVVNEILSYKSDALIYII